MSTCYIFADEAGNFDFSTKEGASRYFMLCTTTMFDCSAGATLLDLRRKLLTEGYPLEKKFHATSDKQDVRNMVFDVIKNIDLRIDATLLEKRKSRPYTRPDESTFYKYAWYYHYKFIAPIVIPRDSHALITAAEISIKQKKAAYKEAINAVAQQVTKHNNWTLSFPPSDSDPCLQIADYCAWAIQRKWEYGDARSYDLIESKIRSEFDLWRNSRVFYY